MKAGGGGQVVWGTKFDIRPPKSNVVPLCPWSFFTCRQRSRTLYDNSTVDPNRPTRMHADSRAAALAAGGSSCMHGLLFST